MSRVSVSFLVINWNGAGMLAECLESIRCQDEPAYEVIVIDNGSTDASWDLPYFKLAGWRLERLASNTGFSGANNLAYQYSQGDYVALINNDVTLAPDWTRCMVRALRNSPAAGSAASRLLQYECRDRLDSAGFAWYAAGTVTAWAGWKAGAFSGSGHHPFGAVASAAMYRRSALEKVGLFRAEFFAYYEDTDLAARLTLFGFDCLYVNEAVAFHRGSSTGARSLRFKEYHLRRNIEYVFWRNMLGDLAIRYLFIHVLYEAGVFLKMLAAGRGGVFIQAKRDAWARRRWIAEERRALARKLMDDGVYPQARQRLMGALTPWWKWFSKKAGWRLCRN